MRRLMAGLVPVMAMLAGCTAEDGAMPGNGPAPLAETIATVEGAAGEPAAEIPVISTEEQMLSYSALPLDAYSLEFDHRLVDRAYDKLLAQCMAEQGFDSRWDPYYRPTFPDPAPRPPLLARYGLGILAEAQQYGYQGPPYAGPTKPPLPPPLSPAEQAALEVALLGPEEDRQKQEPPQVRSGWVVQGSGGFAFAPDSCTARAWAALEVTAYTQISTAHGSVLVSELMWETYRSAEADSRVVAADRAWSACVKEKGFDAPSPEELSLAYGELGVDAQIPAAVADVECKYATNYFGIRYGVESAYQKVAIEENFQELEAIAAANRLTVERAKAVLNE